MKFKLFSLEQEDEWDTIVKSFINYEVYYLSGYVKAFEINGDGKAYLFYCEDGDTRAINVFMKRDVAEIPFFATKISPLTYFDIVTPYGYGGFIVEGDKEEKVEQVFKNFCEDSGIIAEFVRYNPMTKNWNAMQDLYEHCYSGKTVYLDLQSEEEIWKNMTSKNRNMVRKAQKAGLKTYWGRDKEIIKPFMDIYNKTMEKDDASDYYFFKQEFYESILEDLKYNSMWFYTKLDNMIASIAIFLYANGNMHYHLSASRKEYQNFAPTNLLLYEAALWGCRNGYKKMHLGGGVGAQEDSLYKFKKAFNRYNDSCFYVGKHIYNVDIYKELLEIREKIEKPREANFFPEYRG